VLGRRPEFGPALYRRAHCLEDLGRHAEAEVDVSVILRGHPQDADARALFDRVRAAQGLPHGDADLPRPETRDQWMARASAAAVQGDHAAVVEAYDHVLRLAPGLTVLRLYRGASLEALGQYARAAEDYEAYLRIEPAHQWAKDRLAAARSKLAAG